LKVQKRVPGDLVLRRRTRAITNERGHRLAEEKGLLRVSTLNFSLSTQP
jgi:hypothetical protein